MKTKKATKENSDSYPNRIKRAASSRILPNLDESLIYDSSTSILEKDLASRNSETPLNCMLFHKENKVLNSRKNPKPRYVTFISGVQYIGFHHERRALHRLKSSQLKLL